MKLRNVTFFAFVCCNLIAFGEPNPENLLVNGGFETPCEEEPCAKGWSKVVLSKGLADGAVEARQTPAETHSGKAAYQLKAKVKSGYGYSQGTHIKFDAPYPTRVLLHGYVKGQISGRTFLCAWVRVQNEKEFRILSGKPIKNAPEWQAESLLISAQGIQGITVVAIASGQGCVFWDDLSLVTLPEVAQRSLVRGTLTATPPKIDGLLDDACWNESTRLMPFTVAGSAELAKEPTEGYVAYDQENLYVALECYESKLNPISNSLHEFKALAKERDGKVFADDCVEIFIDPRRANAAAKGYFHIAANSLATICDAEGCNRAWNATISAKASVNERSWMIEFAIPFKSFGLAAPKEGEAWGFNLCREEKPLKENSSWAKVEGGFHQPHNFGQLVFGGHNPVAIRKLDLREDDFRVTLKNLTPQPQRIGLALESIPTDQKPKVSFEPLQIPANTETTFALHYPAVAKGKAQTKFNWYDVASRRSYYAIERVCYSEIYNVQLKTATRAGHTLYLNGQKQGNFSGAELQETSWVLRPGLNVIAVQCKGQPGALLSKMRITETGQTIVTDYGWLATTEPGENWTAPDSKVVGWRSAAVLNAPEVEEWAKGFADLADAHPIWLAPEKESGRRDVCFRRAILVHESAHPANYRNGDTVYVNQGDAQPFQFAYDRAFLKDFDLFWELPSEDELLPNAGLTISSKEIRKNGKPYRQYRFHNLGAAGGRACPAVVRHSPSKPGSFYYYVQSPDGSTTEHEKELQVVTLPPLAGRRPSKTIFGLYFAFKSDLPWAPSYSIENTRRIIQTAKQAGFNLAMIESIPKCKEYDLQELAEGDLVRDLYTQEGFDLCGLFYDYDCMPARVRTDLHPEERGMGARGKPCICKTVALEDGCERCDQFLMERVRRLKLRYYCWDHEFNPFLRACYCPRCLKNFRAAHKLPLDLALSPQLIKEKYGEEWIQFQCDLSARLAKHFQELVHRADSSARFMVYSGYQGESTRRHYSVDWTTMGKACDLVSCGYGATGKLLQRTRESAQKPMLPGILLYDFGKKHHQLHFPQILRQLFGSNGVGVFVFCHTGMDAQDYQVAAKASRFMSDYEEFFQKPEYDPAFAEFNGGEVTILAKQNERLIVLFNNSPGAVSIEGRWRLKEKDAVLDCLTGEYVEPRMPLKLTIPGTEAMVLLVAPRANLEKKGARL
ncbi:MAG: sugar-binding protein [Verrucomicrobiae bacterium]|nr:sugar-binding protein [Verrucomicrobiae bacterium]